MHLSLESMAWLRARSPSPGAPFAQVSDHDEDGVQEGTFTIEPRITFTVRSFTDGREEERQWFVDGDPVDSFDAAIKKIAAEG